MRFVTGLFIAAFSILMCGTCLGGTIIVDPGGGGDALSITGGLALATVGDPLLCDPEAGDFQIDCQSPCNVHPGCSMVGALGVGCGSTRTEPTTWGAIKAMHK